MTSKSIFGTPVYCFLISSIIFFYMAIHDVCVQNQERVALIHNKNGRKLV